MIYIKIVMLVFGVTLFGKRRPFCR